MGRIQQAWEALGERWGYDRSGSAREAREGWPWTLWWTINDWMMGAWHWPGQSPYSCHCGASGWRWPCSVAVHRASFMRDCRWHQGSWLAYMRNRRA